MFSLTLVSSLTLLSTRLSGECDADAKTAAVICLAVCLMLNSTFDQVVVVLL